MSSVLILRALDMAGGGYPPPITGVAVMRAPEALVEFTGTFTGHYTGTFDLVLPQAEIAFPGSYLWLDIPEALVQFSGTFSFVADSFDLTAEELIPSFESGGIIGGDFDLTLPEAVVEFTGTTSNMPVFGPVLPEALVEFDGTAGISTDWDATLPRATVSFTGTFSILGGTFDLVLPAAQVNFQAAQNIVIVVSSGPGGGVRLFAAGPENAALGGG